MKSADLPTSPALKRPVPGDVASTAAERSMPVGLAAPVRLIWDSLIPIHLQDARFRIVDANLAYLRFTGYAHERLVGMDPLELQPPQDRKATLAWRARMARDAARADAAPAQPERLIDRTGNERWYRASRSPLTDAEGRTFWMSVMQECTIEHQERLRAERADAETALWLDLSPQGMALFDASGQLVKSNAAFERLVGLPLLRLSDASPELQQLLAWDPGGPSPQLQRSAAALSRQVWLPNASGGARRLRASVRCHESTDGLRRYMAVLEDLSIEEERDLARSQRDALMDAAGVGLSTFQQASGWVTPPQSGADAAQPSAALQAINRDLVLPESMADYERLQQALRQSRRAEVRYAISHPEFGQRWLLTRVEPAKLASGIQSTSVITLDVTEQHLAQQRNEQLLRDMGTIMEHATAGIAYLRGNVLVRCNRRFEQMLGMPGDAPAG
ncbi:MAG: PAS domain S-box protein, partial [Rhizobacter sp.]|nr:PAS domain S-box protein [Rhizobacter sp.]